MRITGPGRRILTEAKAIAAPAGDRFVWLSDVGGEYSIAVSAVEPLLPGEYRMRVETRGVVARDSWRIAALQAESEAARHLDSREIDEAIAEMERVRLHWQRSGEHVAEIQALLDLADLEEESGRIDEAFRRYDEAERVAEESADLGWVAETMLRRGRLHARLGQMQRAEETYRLARSVAERGGDGVRVATIAYNEGILLLRRGQVDDAWDALVEVGELARAALDPLTEAYALLGRARILKRRFEVASAHELALQALEIARQAGEDGSEAQAVIAHELGNLSMQQGDLAGALESFEESVRLNSSGGNWSQVAQSLRSLGVLALSLRDQRRAEGYARRALELAQAFGDPIGIAECSRELGAVLAWRGQREDAEDLYQRAIDLVPEGEDGLRGSILHRLAVLDLDRGKTEEAIERLRLAAGLRRRAGDRDGLGLTLLKLGTALIDAGRLDEARAQLEAALDHYRRRGWPDEIAICLYHLARLEVEAGRLDAARDAIEEALDLVRHLRAGLTTDAMKLEFFSRVRPLYDLQVHLLMRLAAARPGEGYEALAFRASEEARARGLLDLLSEADVDLRRGIDPVLEREAVEIERNLIFLRSQLANAQATDPGSAQATHLRDLYEATEEQLGQLDRRLQALSSDYQEVQSAQPLELEEVMSLLGRRRALIQYWVGERSSFVFAVTDDGLEVRELAPAEELRERAAALRVGVRAMLPRERFADDARRLYIDLLKPVEAVIRDRIEWIIVPDGPLQIVPFEALVGSGPNGGGRYLVESRAISYAPSASVLRALERRATPGPVAASPRFIVFADPAVEGSAAVICPREERPGNEEALEPALSVTALPASRLEGKELIGLHGAGASRAFFGVAATEDAVKHGAGVPAAARIHFATHGVVCESRPERSALVLASSADGEDGLLELREIFGLRLSADLVVLSACDTGLGKNVEGEGVVGLARAFLYAGAESVVVSLWKVADESTAELMLAFYRELESRGPDADKAEALRAAKRAMIAEGGTRAHPFHWASFILIGSRDTAKR